MIPNKIPGERNLSSQFRDTLIEERGLINWAIAEIAHAVKNDYGNKASLAVDTALSKYGVSKEAFLADAESMLGNWVMVVEKFKNNEDLINSIKRVKDDRKSSVAKEESLDYIFSILADALVKEVKVSEDEKSS